MVATQQSLKEFASALVVALRRDVEPDSKPLAPEATTNKPVEPAELAPVEPPAPAEPVEPPAPAEPALVEPPVAEPAPAEPPAPVEPVPPAPADAEVRTEPTREAVPPAAPIAVETPPAPAPALAFPASAPAPEALEPAPTHGLVSAGATQMDMETAVFDAETQPGEVSPLSMEELKSMSEGA